MTIYLHQYITFMRKVQSRNDRRVDVADILLAWLQSESWQKQASISYPSGPAVFGHLLLLMGTVPKLLFSTPVPQKEEVYTAVSVPCKNLVYLTQLCPPLLVQVQV